MLCIGVVYKVKITVLMLLSQSGRDRYGLPCTPETKLVSFDAHHIHLAEVSTFVHDQWSLVKSSCDVMLYSQHGCLGTVQRLL